MLCSLQSDTDTVPAHRLRVCSYLVFVSPARFVCSCGKLKRSPDNGEWERLHSLCSAAVALKTNSLELKKEHPFVLIIPQNRLWSLSTLSGVMLLPDTCDMLLNILVPEMSKVCVCQMVQKQVHVSRFYT